MTTTQIVTATQRTLSSVHTAEPIWKKTQANTGTRKRRRQQNENTLKIGATVECQKE